MKDFIQYTLIFASQILFNIFKTYEIRYTYENKMRSLLVNTVLINLVSLAITYLSIESLLKGDYIVVLVYIVGSVVGKWIAMTKFSNKIFRIFRKSDRSS
jgi:uncharacterized membrane protein YqgA involved in biofilm formation